MKTTLISLVLMASGFAPVVRGTTFNLYDNTENDTGDFVAYSITDPPYLALGDQIELVSAGTADEAEVELYNNGSAGTFNAELDLSALGSPVGALLGTFDYPTQITSIGGDVLDLTFELGGLALPQDFIFTVSVSNVTAGVDLGVDMSQPVTLGTSDPDSMIVETTGSVYSTITTNDENVFFGLSGTPTTAAPEVSSLALFGSGLLVMAMALRRRGRLYAQPWAL